MKIENKYFGTDGIRGIPNKDLNLCFLEKLGKALKVLNNDKVIVATDTRYSKDFLAFSIISGCLSNGLNVTYAGILSTPALIYYCYKHRGIGVMITASHNPYYYNGIKIIKDGYKLTQAEEQLIEQALDSLEISSELGTFSFQPNIQNDYLQFLLPYVKPCGLKVCIDCANGSNYKLAPFVFSKICNDLVVISNHPNGYNINDHCGATDLSSLQEQVLKHQCDIGFAYDGDGDRVICVDRKGNVIDGDLIIYILASYLKDKKVLKNNQVVLTVMSNLGIIHALQAKGIEVLEVPVGDKHVVKALNEKELSIGGEASGHIIIPTLFHSGDGLMISLYLLKVLLEEKKDLTDYTKEVSLYFNRMINIQVEDKRKILDNQSLYQRVEEIKEILNQDCKIIIRPSGTENVVRLNVMAKSKELVDQYIEELNQLIQE